MDWIVNSFDAAFESAFSQVTQPLLFALGLMHYWDEAFLGTETVLLGALEITLLACIVVPLERVRPFETRQDAAARRTDFAYTVINRLGLLPLLLFAILFPLESVADGLMHAWGVSRVTLQTLIPALAQQPLLAFACYLALFDLLGYWVHRGQHAFGWWWALHAVHHSQRAMSVWTESRNHYLDDLLNALIFALAARLIGTPGTQFIWLVFASRLIESFSHANLRFGFGAIGARLVVDPYFHRIHHGVGIGHEGPARGVNFAVLFPLWDLLFGTARLERVVAPTGIRDQSQGHDYGVGLLAQQRLGLSRMLGRRRPESARFAD